MSAQPSRSARRIAATAAGAVAVLGLTSLPGVAATAPGHGDLSTSPAVAAARGDAKGSYDARATTVAGQAFGQAAAVAAKTGVLGSGASVDLDALTLTPRNLSALDGYLTAASTAAPQQVVTDYLAAHLAAVGLTRADLSTFTLRTSYQDVAGIHHLSWSQSVAGTPVFGNGLKANLTKDGRIISIQGSPVSGLAALAARAPGGSLDAARARSGAASDVQGTADAAATVAGKSGADTVWSNNDFARQVWFLTPAGLRKGWSTYVQTGKGAAYQHVVDAATGRVLYRHSTVANDNGDAYVYDNYPGAPKGGQPKVVNFVRKGWLNKGATWLNGANVVAWTDVNDDNAVSPGEKTAVPGDAAGATFPLVHFNGALAGCSSAYVCTWNPAIKNSWQKNRDADAANAFYLANTYHDYLTAAPFGFTAQAGNFEKGGGDPVLLQALDGADTAGGLPDANHIDNANMSTPPDGTPPTMQMYLWHQPGTTPAQDPFIPMSGGFDASILLHEYTHGLSNRLVVDAAGNSTLSSIQAGSMGEAWSDYYAMDYLVTKGFVSDTATAGEVLEGAYTLAGGLFRTEAIDCPVTATAANCTGIDGVKGGYTYGDFPTIGGSPEVHSSGEVWAQTLWDLRTALGHDVADAVITRAMTLSPADPSMLDMRNAILKADEVVYGNAHTATIWKIFAARGMGWFAGAIDAGDSYPAEDFHVRPAAQTPRTSISGTVTDPTDGNKPLAGVVVHVTGHDSGYSSDYTAVTNGAGRYTIGNVFPGTYAKVVATAPGYEPVAKPINTRKPTQGDFVLRRDWSAASGGADITDFNGPDYSSFNCGPLGAIDLSHGTGWGSTTGDDAATPTNVFVPKFIVVDLKKAIDVESFGVDPSATCGDPGSSSTGAFKIELSTDGTTWTPAASGTFDATNRGIYNPVPATGSTTGTRYVKFTILGNQVPDFATSCPTGGYGGCTYTDLTELQVFGKATA
ncbi:M36 family metallopeptidase [Lapillicoccus sp.]|uniref:M36 family metallopeptidase n=1 Tax=Lapillicoccus sp. TaxID=1909287 RepID=UPI0025F3C04F|nr:M36 family metallopeptidase [Lapillicoccus sp.]